MLSAVTTTVAVDAWSVDTDLAVVVISKSNIQVPATSRVTGAGSGAAMVMVAAVWPTDWVEPTGTVMYLIVTV